MNIEQQITDACEALRKELIEKLSPKEEYKKDDWIVFTDFGNVIRPPFTLGKPYQLLHDIVRDAIDVVDDNGFRNGYCEYAFEVVSFRHATPEEIALTNFPPDGTACLVRDYIDRSWILAYSNGKGKFYKKCKKNSETIGWAYYQILDPNNLPVNE